MEKNKNIRIKDIAQMAGVSVGTVDRVIHNRGNVSTDIEQKVQNILEETGYTANPIAQSLGASKDYHIAVMMPNPEQDKYWELAGTGIDQAQKEWKSYNQHITLYPFNLYDADSFSDVSNEILQAEPDAVLTIPMFYEQSLAFFRKLHRADIPYVLFNTQVENKFKQFTPLCFIGPNLYQSGRVAAELMNFVLPNMEKAAILHIHKNAESSMQLSEKERGFKDYYRGKKLNPHIASHTFITNEESFESQISQLVAKTTCEGIFVSTSSPTSAAARALKKHQKKNILLIGYDLLDQNIQFLKDGIIDFLINQNPWYQVFQGLRYLVNHLTLNESIPKTDLLPIEIITKENCESFLNNNDSNFL